jgi:hypothetical protein
LPLELLRDKFSDLSFKNLETLAKQLEAKESERDCPNKSKFASIPEGLKEALHNYSPHQQFSETASTAHDASPKLDQCPVHQKANIGSAACAIAPKCLNHERGLVEGATCARRLHTTMRKLSRPGGGSSTHV